MGEVTKIQWAHHTFNGWIGCDEVDPLCDHCYAKHETYVRVQRAAGRELWGPQAERHVTSHANWRKPFKWNREAIEAGERRRVFCHSLGDVAERPRSTMLQVLDEARARLWPMIEECSALDWMLLTKRPHNFEKVVPERWLLDWPKHVWVGTSVGVQKAAAQRICELRRIPAWVHFLSMEPLLEHVELDDRIFEWTPTGPDENGESNLLRPIRLVIVGGESGAGARPCRMSWIESLVRQCSTAGASCFVKQLGAEPWDDRLWRGVDSPMGLRDRKGGDLSEWPADLQVRQMPEARP